MPLQSINDTSSSTSCYAPTHVSGVPTPITPGIWPTTFPIGTPPLQCSQCRVQTGLSGSSVCLYHRAIITTNVRLSYMLILFQLRSYHYFFCSSQQMSNVLVLFLFSVLAIIDNVLRHSPDQQITFYECGIVNNVFTVTLEACSDVTCFCSNRRGSHKPKDNKADPT